MKKKLKSARKILFIVLLFIPGLLMAQTDPDPFDPDVNDNDVPIDGGVSLLIAAGIGYGVKKVYDKRREEKQSKTDNF